MKAQEYLSQNWTDNSKHNNYLVIVMAVAIIAPLLYALLTGNILLLGVFLVFFILLPDTTHKVANILGVGRGVDLIFYLAHSLMLILLGLLYAKNKRNDYIVTRLVRHVAILEARSVNTDQKAS